MIGQYRDPTVGQFVPARDAEIVWNKTRAVVLAAITFAGTWRPCYEGCECIRCDLAVKAGELAATVERGR